MSFYWGRGFPTGSAGPGVIQTESLPKLIKCPLNRDTGEAFSQTFNARHDSIKRCGYPYSTEGARRGCETYSGHTKAKWQSQGSEPLCIFPHTHPSTSASQKKARHYPEKCYLYIKRAKRFCMYNKIRNLIIAHEALQDLAPSTFSNASLVLISPLRTLLYLEISSCLPLSI